MKGHTVKTSPVIVICSTVVAVAAIVAIAVLVAVGSDAESIGLLIGLVTMLVTSIVSLTRTEQIKGTVDDLSNGRMDAKIRAGVADVLGEHLIDPTVRDQLDVDRARRGEHA
jgi:hypothetical protein